MSLFEVYKMGGPFMHLISLMAILMLLVTVWKIVLLVGNKTVNLSLLGLILMAGSVALAIGLLGQILGIIGALEAIRVATDVSPELVMGGAIVSFYAPIWGFVVFIFSTLFYFILKEIIKAKLPE
jgi:hypothetical protein